MIDPPIPDIPGARHVMSIHVVDNPMQQFGISDCFLIQAREPINLGSAGGPATMLCVGAVGSKKDVIECVKAFFNDEHMHGSLRPAKPFVNVPPAGEEE